MTFSYLPDAELIRAARQFLDRTQPPSMPNLADIHALLQQFGQQGETLKVGTQAMLVITKSCELVEWVLDATVAGSCTIDIWWSPWATPRVWVPWITGSGVRPHLYNQDTHSSINLTDWNPIILSRKDALLIRVTEARLVEQVTLTLYMKELGHGLASQPDMPPWDTGDGPALPPEPGSGGGDGGGTTTGGGTVAFVSDTTHTKQFRVTPSLGEAFPADWEQPTFDDAAWSNAVEATVEGTQTYPEGSTPIWTTTAPEHGDEEVAFRRPIDTTIGAAIASATVEVIGAEYLADLTFNGNVIAEGPLSEGGSFDIPPEWFTLGPGNVLAVRGINATATGGTTRVAITEGFVPTDDNTGKITPDNSAFPADAVNLVVTYDTGGTGFPDEHWVGWRNSDGGYENMVHERTSYPLAPGGETSSVIDRARYSGWMFYTNGRGGSWSLYAEYADETGIDYAFVAFKVVVTYA